MPLKVVITIEQTQFTCPTAKYWFTLYFPQKPGAPYHKGAKALLLAHIKQNSIAKSIFIDTMNCVEDHIHILISLGTDQSIARVAMLLKGESSCWVNKQKLSKEKFEWQDEYYEASISKNDLFRVRDYIEKQEAHNSQKTFQRECEKFRAEYDTKNKFGSDASIN